MKPRPVVHRALTFHGLARLSTKHFLDMGLHLQKTARANGHSKLQLNWPLASIVQTDSQVILEAWVHLAL